MIFLKNFIILRGFSGKFERDLTQRQLLILNFITKFAWNDFVILSGLYFKNFYFQ